MARPITQDYLHAMKFHVVSDGEDFLNVDGSVEAGFSSVTTPELTIEVAEYKEGTMTYVRKFPGNPTVSDITLSKGIVKKDTVFYDWMMQVLHGNELSYRKDFTIRHYHRDDQSKISKDVDSRRSYEIKEAWPIRCKIAGDLDANTSDVSVQELDVSCEFFQLNDKEKKAIVSPAK